MIQQPQTAPHRGLAEGMDRPGQTLSQRRAEGAETPDDAIADASTCDRTHSMHAGEPITVPMISFRTIGTGPPL